MILRSSDLRLKILLFFLALGTFLLKTNKVGPIQQWGDFKYKMSLIYQGSKALLWWNVNWNPDGILIGPSLYQGYLSASQKKLHWSQFSWNVLKRRSCHVLQFKLFCWIWLIGWLHVQYKFFILFTKSLHDHWLLSDHLDV